MKVAVVNRIGSGDHFGNGKASATFCSLVPRFLPSHNSVPRCPSPPSMRSSHRSSHCRQSSHPQHHGFA